MATVTIDGREFQVKHKTEPGGMIRKRDRIEAAVAVQQAEGTAVFEKLAAFVGSYLVDADTQWLLEHLPEDVNPILRQCIEAVGDKVAEPGEASSQ